MSLCKYLLPEVIRIVERPTVAEALDRAVAIRGGAGTEDIVKAVIDMTDGGADYSFEASCAGGTACMVGVPPDGGEVTIPMRPLFLDWRLVGSSAGTGRPRVDFRLFIELYRQGRLKIDALQSKFRPLDEINEAFEDVLSGNVARTIVTP